jgi:hypothetical protein
MYQEFEMYILYSQIAVFAPDLNDPFNEWTPRHNAQGFTWRPGSVSFATFESGSMHLEVSVREQLLLSPRSRRVIAVPFTSPASSQVAIATIGDDINTEKKITLPAGIYELIFEHNHEEPMWVRLNFVPEDMPEARIIRADPQLSPIFPLLLTANSA